MSGVEGKIAINLEDRVTPKARQISGALKKTEADSKQAFNGMAAAGQKAEAQMKRTASAANQTGAATGALATSVFGLTTNITAFQTSLTQIPTRILDIEKAENALIRSQDSLQKTTHAVDKAQRQLDADMAAGKLTVEQITDREKELALARRDLSAATRDVAEKQGDLNLKHEEYRNALITTATTAGTTAITAFATVSSMLALMAANADMTTGAFVRMKLATITNSRVLRVLGIDLKTAMMNFRGLSVATTASGASMVVASTGVNRLGLAFKGLYVAMGPIGWGIIGITTAYEIFAHNVFGARDALHGFVDQIVEMFPILQGLADLVRWLFPDDALEGGDRMADIAADAAAAVEAYGGAAGMAAGQTGAMSMSVDGAGAAFVRANGAVATFGATVSSTGSAIQGFEGNAAGLANSIVKMYDLAAGEGVRALRSEVDQLTAAIGYAAKGMDLTGAEWSTVLAHMGSDVDAYGKKVYDTWGPHAFFKYKKEMEAFGFEVTNVHKQMREQAAMTADAFASANAVIAGGMGAAGQSKKNDRDGPAESKMTLRRGYEYRTYGGYAGEVLKEIGDGLDVSAPWGTSTAASFGRAIIRSIDRRATGNLHGASRRTPGASGEWGGRTNLRTARGRRRRGRRRDHAMEQAAAILGVGFGQRGSMGGLFADDDDPWEMWAVQQFGTGPGRSGSDPRITARAIKGRIGAFRESFADAFASDRDLAELVPRQIESYWRGNLSPIWSVAHIEETLERLLKRRNYIQELLGMDFSAQQKTENAEHGHYHMTNMIARAERLEELAIVK